MSTAIIITGTICSGKTTISEMISERLNIPLFSEGNVFPRGLTGILDAIKSGKFTDSVLVEHADILNFMDDIVRYFDKQIMILLNVSEKILTDNLDNRKSKSIIGDYLNVDICQMKKNIIKKFEELKGEKITYVVDITDHSDYERACENIVEFLSSNLHVRS